jgi:hypothetical protein
MLFRGSRPRFALATKLADPNDQSRVTQQNWNGLDPDLRRVPPPDGYLRDWRADFGALRLGA